MKIFWLFPEIYYAGGTVTRDISSRDLTDYAVSLGKQARFFETRAECGEFLKTKTPAPATALSSWAP